MQNPISALRMVAAFTQIVRDPNRLNDIFDLIDTIADDPVATAEFEAAFADPQVADAAARRVRVPDLSIDYLKTLPPGSAGDVASGFFRANGLDPAALPRREAETDVKWLLAHVYETHDLWHVVSGFGPDVAGELGLQAFYAAQLNGPVPLAILSAGMMNTLIYAQAETRARLASIARGWALGTRVRSFVGLDWAELMSRPLADVRRELNVDIAPEHDAMRAFTASASLAA